LVSIWFSIDTPAIENGPNLLKKKDSRDAQSTLQQGGAKQNFEAIFSLEKCARAALIPPVQN
jgi:hypothetical protein